MLKNIIKVDEKYFTVTLDADGRPEVKEADTQQVIDQEFEDLVIFKEEGDEEIADVSMFQKLIDQTRNDMETSMAKELKNLVLSALGFSSSHDGSWRVNGYTDKQSPVAKAIADKVAAKILGVDLNKEFDLTPKEKGKLKAEMTAFYKDEFRRQVRSSIYEEVRRDAQEAVREAKQSIIGDKLKIVARSLVDSAVEKTKNRWER